MDFQSNQVDFSQDLLVLLIHFISIYFDDSPQLDVLVHAPISVASLQQQKRQTKVNANVRKGR